MFSKVDGAIADAIAREKQRDEISDDYCDVAVSNCIRKMKDVGVSVADIEMAFRRATLEMRKVDAAKREGEE
jgi:hypothetical protein